MADAAQSWQAEIVKTVNNMSDQQVNEDLPSKVTTPSEEETVNKDFQLFVNTLFSSEARCERSLDHQVHKGVNLSEVLSRLEAIIPNPGKQILPVDVYNQIVILSNNLETYLQLFNERELDTAADRIFTDTVKWVTTLFGLDNGGAIFHKQKVKGLLKVCRLALHSKFPKYATDGFTALYTRPPVVYISAAAPPEFGKQLRTELGLPQSSICTVPCNTMFGSPFAMDVASFERLVTDDVSCGKTPLILIAYAGTPLSGHTDNIGRLREICTQSGVWLHVEGDTLANLSLSHVQPSIQVASGADSLTFNLSRWFGMITLPYCTFYRSNNPALAVSAGLDVNITKKLVALPLWIIIQFMGTHDLKKIIEHASGLSQQMCNRLDMINGIKRIEQPTGISPIVLFKYKAAPTIPLSLESEDETIKHKKAAPRGKIDVSPKLAETLNKYIISELSNSVPKVKIETVHIPREGTCLKFNPLQTSRRHKTSKAAIDDFVDELQSIIVRMDCTLVNRSSFQETLHRIADVVVLDVSDEPAIGAFQCIPKYWKTKSMSNLSDLKKEEANELNRNVFLGLSHQYPSLQQCILPNGQHCIQMGIVDDNLNLQQFGELVLKCTIEMEDNAKYVEGLKDSVQQSIEEAQTRLERERDEKFFQDGVLRNVPLVSSLYNWWSPPPKESHGVTGKSFDLSSGKLESTDKIYKYKMQIHDDQSDKLSEQSRSSTKQQQQEEEQDEDGDEETDTKQQKEEGDSLKLDHENPEKTEERTDVKESEV